MGFFKIGFNAFAGLPDDGVDGVLIVLDDIKGEVTTVGEMVTDGDDNLIGGAVTGVTGVVFVDVDVTAVVFDGMVVEDNDASSDCGVATGCVGDLPFCVVAVAATDETTFSLCNV